MKTGFENKKRQAGFTLLEVVVTLIVASILGVILLEFMGTTVQESYRPIYMTQDSMDVNQIMERMNATYKERLLLREDPLAVFKADVEGGNNISNQPYYYGDYTVQADWIRFDSNGDQVPDVSGDNRILKVKVTRNNRSVTSLFVK
jgi:prepilin-type N-terminal cleavage/methylation domain-containing protein